MNDYDYERGAIRSVAHYQQAKMLDHSSWQKGELILPRKITPSDVDICFDNKGKVLFCELSTASEFWSQASEGQRIAYQNMIRGTVHCAIMAMHSVTPNDVRLIDTRTDIISFQPMAHDGSEFIVVGPFYGNDVWQRFIFSWFQNAARLRRILFGHSLGMVWGRRGIE